MTVCSYNQHTLNDGQLWDLLSLSDAMNVEQVGPSDGKVSKYRKIFKSIDRYVSTFFIRKTFVESHMRRFDYFIGIDGILMHPIARKLFSKYISSLGGLSNESLRNIKCFDICLSIIREGGLQIVGELRLNLFSNCPTYLWVERLESDLRNYDMNVEGVTDEIFRTLVELRNECALQIEIGEVYRKFRKEISNRSNRIKNMLSDIFYETNGFLQTV